jgi:hypothetical protein
MRERSSLEAAFLHYWPSPKAQGKSISLAAVDREVTDRTGMGTPDGWSDWYHEGSKYRVMRRVSLGEGNSIQLKNTGEEIAKVSAEHALAVSPYF